MRGAGSEDGQRDSRATQEQMRNRNRAEERASTSRPIGEQRARRLHGEQRQEPGARLASMGGRGSRLPWASSSRTSRGQRRARPDAMCNREERSSERREIEEKEDAQELKPGAGDFYPAMAEKKIKDEDAGFFHGLSDVAGRSKKPWRV